MMRTAAIFSVFLFFADISTGYSQSPAPQAPAGQARRFNIELPPRARVTLAISQALEELEREPCDKTAIQNLGKALGTNGYRREAVKAHLRFSETCGGHVPSLREAVNMLMNLSDYEEAATVASKLIELSPFNDNGYFLRALAYYDGGQYRKAIDDFTTAVELFANKDRISSVSYYHMALAYDKLGQFCDAAAPIETWVNHNPARNDTSQARAMIASYVAKGNCPKASATEVTFPARRGQTVQVPVTINGVKGTFILDTGATFVSVKRSFADKAKLTVDESSSIKLNTANGIASAKRGTAKTVEVRTLKAEDVPVVVQTDAKGSYGNGVDGLLGMSFLSRFQLTVAGNTVKIKSRNAK
jgi:aspartyl protease family protein